ncbi:hypothetical protein [Sporosarcina sp. OR05]|uniref:hypothetical protein n=1 Tax=Sporosarcina sp. OR05 TaxID=2969819 RepID=UPI00352AAFE4
MFTVLRYTPFLYFAYRVFLDLIYIAFQNPIFSYMGYDLDIDIIKLIISYTLLIILIFFIPKHEKRVSSLILQLHFIIIIIPMTCLYSMANFSSIFMFMIFFGFLMQILLLELLPNIKLPKIKHIKPIFICFIFITTIATYTYLFLTQSINISAFDFKGIYEIREDQLVHFPFGYLITWQYRIINPLLIIYFFINKKYKIMILIVIAQIIMYTMYPHKEVFLAIGYLFLLLFLYKKKIKFSLVFLWLMPIISILTSLIYKFSSELIYYAIIPSRLLFGPAKIKFQHYDFFSMFEKLYFSEGLIGKLLGIEYPYSVQSGYVVSLHNGFDSNSNTGYIAYAYDNLGFLGIIIMSFLFVLILKLIDSQTQKIDSKLIFAILGYPMLILNDGDLFTLLLTGGLFIIILVGFFIDELVGEKT